MLKSSADAYELLERLDAPDRLIDHARYVGEAAKALMSEFARKAS